MFRETAFKTKRNISINQRTNLAGPAHIININAKENRVAVATLKFCYRKSLQRNGKRAICDIKWVEM